MHYHTIPFGVRESRNWEGEHKMSNSGEWGVSSDDQALVDSFFGGESDQPATEAVAEESVNIENSEADADVDESEANTQEAADANTESADGQDDDAGAEDEGESEPSEPLVIKGPSGKDITVDLNPDKDKLVKLHQAADRARMYQSELDKLKHQAESTSQTLESLKEVEGHFKKIEEVVEDIEFGDPSSYNDLIALVTGGEIDMDTLIEKAVEERNDLADLSDEGLALYEERKRIKREARALEKERAKIQKEAKTREQERAQQQEQNQKELIFQAFQKHDIRGKTGDSGYEEKVMRAAWNNSREELVRLQKEGTELTYELVDQVFKDEIDGLYKPASKVAQKETAKVVNKAKAKATKKAQESVTKPKGNLEEMLGQYKNPWDILNDPNALDKIQL